MENKMGMDKELAHGAKTAMETAISDLRTALENMSSNVNDLVGTSGGYGEGTWYGNAASDFATIYYEWAGKMSGSIEEIESLKNRLGKEIDDWEFSDKGLE